MGGITAFGYEKENGTVAYIITRDSGIHYIKERKVPKYVSKQNICNDDSFFCSELSKAEKSEVRVLYKLDGSTIIKNFNSNLDPI
jgi:hypothetical protein